MLGVAGILAQEIVKPGVFFYNAGLPENLPNINFGGPDGKVTQAALTTSAWSLHGILTGEQDLMQYYTSSAQQIWLRAQSQLRFESPSGPASRLTWLTSVFR